MTTYSAGQYRDYFARRAHQLSIDAVMASRIGRKDIADSLRQCSRDYMSKARFAAMKVTA